MKFELDTPIDKSISITAQKIGAITVDFSTGLLQITVGDYEKVTDEAAYETRVSETALNTLDRHEINIFNSMGIAAMVIALKDGTLKPGHSVGDPYTDLPSPPPSRE